MTYDEKLLHYATAPRATAAKITQIVDGDFVDFWAGRLRGVFVSMGGEWKFKTKEEAIDLARKYRQGCIDDATAMGILKL